MKRLLFLLLIPFVMGAQIIRPSPLGDILMSGKKNASTTFYYGGNHTYFVDAVNGNDANQGYQRSDRAWQTITKVNAATFAAEVEPTTSYIISGNAVP